MYTKYISIPLCTFTHIHTHTYTYTLYSKTITDLEGLVVYPLLHLLLVHVVRVVPSSHAQHRHITTTPIMSPLFPFQSPSPLLILPSLPNSLSPSPLLISFSLPFLPVRVRIETVWLPASEEQYGVSLGPARLPI